MRALLATALVACTDPLLPCGDVYSSDPRADVTRVHVQPDSRTPAGTLVQGDLDHALIDAAWDEVERRTGYSVARCAVTVVRDPSCHVHGGVDLLRCDAGGGLCWGAVQHRANVVLCDEATILHEGPHLLAGTSDHGHAAFGPYRDSEAP